MRHLIFDFFGTLVTYHESVGGKRIPRTVRELSKMGVELSADELAERFNECFVRLESAASATLHEFSMGDVVRLLLDGIDVPASDERVARVAQVYLHDWTDGVRGLPRLANWLEDLPTTKSVLSNTHHEPMVVGLLERVGIHASFQHLTTSIGHGYRKPHPSIYRAHLDGIGRNAGDVVFIGDSAECDYFGPREAGIESYLIAARPVSGVSEQHRLTHLYQLIERLQ